MLSLDLIRDFVNNEIPFIESRQTLYGIYYLILRDYRIPYRTAREAWIDYHSRQLDLFNGDHSF